MLSPKTQYNLHNAKEYFEEHLAVGDYYTQGNVVRGEWIGAGARLLALTGAVEKPAFLALCDNLDPRTGERLTVRRATTRRVFYDFTISPPKSVSIAALVGGDDRLVKAHDDAVRIAIQEMERFAATRVHRGKNISERFAATRVHHGRSIADRVTGNMVAAIFRHDTSRALDPHLHTHCVVFNATFDPVENRWKALQNREMLVAQKYVENVYYHELARVLRRFGYQIQNTSRGDFVVTGVPHSLAKTFGKRHAEIDEQTRQLLQSDPHLAARNIAAVREHLAHDRRSRKMQHIGLEVLRQDWRRQMSGPEKATLDQLMEDREVVHDIPSTMDEEAALRWAEEHLFDRKSLVREHELWRFALERGRGENFTVEMLHAATGRADYLRDRDNPTRLTTRPVLQREWDIICLAREGVNACTPLLPDFAGNPALDEAQAAAASKILKSMDRIVLFRGGAGTGKSFTLKTIHDALRVEGRTVQVLAPQRQQVKGLTMDGITGAQTVSEFITRRRMEPGAIVIVDEAGQIGARDMLALLTFVKRNHGRVILSGDTRQHGAVQASDALWAIEKYGRLHVAELNEIRRQDPARARNKRERKWITEYKQAVHEASEGKLARSFKRLDDAGAIVECTTDNQRQALAEHYLELARSGQSTLVVSPTWSEIHRVNDQVRSTLQAEGLIGREEWQVTVFQAEDLTDAQKRDARYYGEQTVIVFNQTSRGVPKGATGTLVALTSEDIVVESAGRIRCIPHRHANRLTLCRTHDMPLAKGDRLQLKANAKAANGQRLLNGELVTVRQVEKSGRIRLEDGRILPPEYRQFVRGYAVTSYASQGKTVDHVLFSDSGIKAATNDQQWYVTISRGRRSVRIFTADKEALRENITRSGRRELAMDIATAAAETQTVSFYGHKTLKAWILEAGRRARAFASIRSRAIHQQPINRPSLR